VLFFSIVQKLSVFRTLLILHATQSLSYKPQHLRHLWTSDQSVIVSCTLQGTTLTTIINNTVGFEPAIPCIYWQQTEFLDRLANEIAQVAVSVQYITFIYCLTLVRTVLSLFLNGKPSENKCFYIILYVNLKNQNRIRTCSHSFQCAPISKKLKHEFRLKKYFRPINSSPQKFAN
jgi:hypothetical protein